MFNCLKNPHRFINFIEFVIGKNQAMAGVNTRTLFPFFINHPCQVRLYKVIPSESFLFNGYEPKLIISRNKHKGKKASRRKYEYENSDDEENEEDEDELEGADDEIHGKNIRLKTYTLNSLRVDLILKNVLKISRKKIEDAFYHNKIRINGKIILKKSQNVETGDNIDLILGFDENSSNSLKVGRLQIFNIKVDPDADQYLIKVCLFKSMVIDNYSQGDAFKAPEEEH